MGAEKSTRKRAWRSEHGRSPQAAYLYRRAIESVCRRTLGQDIATDWIAAYGKYCPGAADCPAYRATYRAVE